MDPLQTLRDGLADDSLRFAILVGLASVPFTVVLSWDPVADDAVVFGGSVEGLPLLLAGLLVGYRYSDRATETRRAGIWTGLAASIAPVLVYVATTVASLGSLSSRMAVLAVALTPIALAFGVGVTVLVTTVCALIADVVTTRLDRDRRTVDASGDDGWDGTGSNWWKHVALYAIAAPVVLGYTLVVFEVWSVPAHAGWLLLTALAAIGLVLYSIVAVVALFMDATAPREADAGWLPRVWVYVGVPLAAYALVYLEAVNRGSVNPAGDGVYGYLVALWAISIVYLVNRRRHGETIRPAALGG
ncbi:DUF5518 domain-containing protein [Natronobeatus ordinarius]|uniref:DUF5518 domain-containing protein n=1 Tax=Natronobeatus ordinarius TaxID=2963433 RepID=UPI0020CDBCE5|nr:DUF5518 domain-containing protein [Natronobeatus ordinarius]